MSTHSLPPPSRLSSLKRTWSGSAQDLDDDDENFTVAPIANKSQKTVVPSTISAASQASSSSQPIVVEDWEPTPPDEQYKIRDRHFLRPQDVNTLASASADPASKAPAPGARISGLSKSSFARTSSKDAAYTHGKTPSSMREHIDEKRSYSDDPQDPSSSSSSSTSASVVKRKLPADFSFKPAQDRIKNGQKPSFFTGPPKTAAASSSSASPHNADAEYRAHEEVVPGMFRLSAQQMYVRDLVVEKGKNVFFTGSAGTGKSVLLRDIIKLLRKRYAKRNDAVAVTASTGIAACNIGGVTLHSFAGIGLGAEDVTAMVKKIKRNRKAVGRWARTQVLIIDEISMVEPDLLDKLERVACLLRKSPKPFGGIQVIITGDFFQLPPVMKTSATRFAFEAEMWDRVMEHKVNLTEVFRQKDQTFVRMLNEMRHGKLTQDSIQRFKQLSRTPHLDENVVPTHLFPHREDVDKANNMRLMQLKVAGETYLAKDGGELPNDMREKILSNFMAPQKVFLKIGAQVMLIKNMDETLVNGSIGKVVAFLDPNEYKMAQIKFPNLYDDEHIKGVRELQAQQKLREASPTKTALSSGSGPSIGNPSGYNTPEAKYAPGGAGNDSAGKKKPAPVPSPASFVKWPLVRFTQPNGGYRTELILPETWKNELPNGEIQASRIQIPLILAWAMSIHKSQGQTIPCCMIDLGKVFEKGQAYVALSRATSLEGLQVLNFRPEKVMAHPRVIEWSKSLSTSTAPGGEAR